MNLLLTRWAYQFQTLQVHRSNDVYVLGNVLCDLTKVKINGQIMLFFFLVNAFPPKPLDMSTSTLQVHIIQHDVRVYGYWAT